MDYELIYSWGATIFLVLSIAFAVGLLSFKYAIAFKYYIVSKDGSWANTATEPMVGGFYGIWMTKEKFHPVVDTFNVLLQWLVHFLLVVIWPVALLGYIAIGIAYILRKRYQNRENFVDNLKGKSRYDS